MRKALLFSALAVGVALGFALHSRSAGGGMVSRHVAAASYARMAAAPPAPPALASNERVRTMARLAGVDPASLRQLHPADQPLGALLTGRDSNGHACVAEASEDVAGSFDCDVFRHGPLHLITGSRGTPARTTWSGFVGVVDASVRRLSVRTAGGSAYDLPLDAAGAFAYGATDAARFPVELSAYDADGRLLLAAALPPTAPPSSG
jgi:hypothetical protein